MLRTILLFIITPFVPLAFAIDTISTGYQVTSSGGTKEITAHGVACKKVTNSGGNDQFISTKTPGEWSNFLSNVPAGLTVTCCGFVYGGNCYYKAGSTGQSCDTVCASRGGCNSAATVGIIGSTGSLAACNAVITGVDTTNTATDEGSASTAIGCALYDYGGYGFSPNRFIGLATTCAATDPSAYRYCSCND